MDIETGERVETELDGFIAKRDRQRRRDEGERAAELAERDPAGYRQIVSEARTEAEHREHAETLLAMFENATERRQEQDRALLDVIFRAELEEGDQ